MDYYALNPSMILRFEFFGGLLHSTLNADEYELDFPNALFLESLSKGYSLDESYKIVEEFFGKSEYNIDLKEYINENIIKKTNEPVLNNKRSIKQFIEEMKNIIITAKSKKYLSFPIQISLYLNSNCQLNCKFCFFSDKRGIYKEFKSKNDWIKLIKKLKENRIIYISILGGEPTLYSGIDDILKCIDELKIKTTITTNAINIKDSTFRIICNSKWITPTISLQSIDDTTNKMLMGTSAKSIINVVECFIENGKLPRINTVITNQTENELYNLVDFCVQHNITEFYTDVYVNNGNNEKLNQHSFLDYRKLKEKMEKYIHNKKYDEKINYQLQGCLLYSAYADIYDEKIDNLYEKIKYGCEGGNTKIEIMPNGDVYPCVMFHHEQFKYDNVFEQDIKEIWNNSSYLNLLRNNICKDNTCLHCKFYDFCNGGCPAIKMRKNKSIESEVDDRCQIIMENK